MSVGYADISVGSHHDTQLAQGRLRSLHAVATTTVLVTVTVGTVSRSVAVQVNIK